ncbi:Restriction enzyme BgcI subunit alpha [Megamonas hypermegale]|uniref:site-specific DNA-methyltransferase (adenine-specific) n=1 Tax=Megamonas hypermegale TaxID=158847 RepID=A0A239TSI0_9FIRM|nr:N-6 DNA methylase [Megamonas hypermegale]SNV00475.1 Restriction enzyme BgcI subunit alpha [Megamonas hypermegale]
MLRYNIIETIGKEFLTSNTETGEYSYVYAAGGKTQLEKKVGHPVSHFKLDIRFEYDDIVVLVETKQHFILNDEKQLKDYLEEEKALHPTKKVICILANTTNDKIKVWKSFIDNEHLLINETVLDKMSHYVKLFKINKSNDRETVLKNTYSLNELLHKKDIDEHLRSQFVGTCLLYIKDIIKKKGIVLITKEFVNSLKEIWILMTPKGIRGAIEGVLSDLLDGSDNKAKKIELLQKNILENQKVRALKTDDWTEILETIILKIYRYIDTDSSEGQDILNMFFIAFNKYTGKADKNQAFTPDHITEFMCRITGVDRTKRILDATCGSGSFLVQAMVKELADCRRGKTEDEALSLMKKVKEEHIYGIEIEEKAYGLSTTNMLIHGDGNSNIKFGNCFYCKQFIIKANPDIILMNPPYNAKPIGIPEKYKIDWGKSKNGKEDPTKGLVFVHFLSDVIKEINDKREKDGLPHKTVKMAVLLPVATAIGNKTIIQSQKVSMLKNNTLEAVFTLPNDIFYPGASASACCMVFTLGEPHIKADGTVKETFFGYYKEDGFKKKKNLGRVEQFDENGNSKWKAIENEWLKLFRNHKVVDGLSATAEVSGKDEWLCEAYMKTDYSTLCQEDFQQTLNNYLAYLIREGKIYES